MPMFISRIRASQLELLEQQQISLVGQYINSSCGFQQKEAVLETFDNVLMFGSLLLTLSSLGDSKLSSFYPCACMNLTHQSAASANAATAAFYVFE